MVPWLIFLSSPENGYNAGGGGYGGRYGGGGYGGGRW